jgi:hypothetical protein
MPQPVKERVKSQLAIKKREQIFMLLYNLFNTAAKLRPSFYINKKYSLFFLTYCNNLFLQQPNPRKTIPPASQPLTKKPCHRSAQAGACAAPPRSA